jgi:hypothetical protein
MALKSLTVGQDTSGWTAQAQADIRSLGQLAPKWDGYGAPAIDPAVIEAAAAFVARLPGDLAVRQPRVVPTASGALQLEWHEGARFLELEFESPHLVRYLQWNAAEGVEEEDSFPVTDVEMAVHLIRWFVAGVPCVPNLGSEATS